MERVSACISSSKKLTSISDSPLNPLPMKLFLPALLFIIILCISCGGPLTPEQQQKDTDRLVSSMVDSGSAGVTVAVAQGDKILYSKGYGFANPEYEISNSPQTIFHVASVSKQFTAFAIALLAEEGKISLDDDIRKYLPELHDFGHKITIKHLVHHTSGLRDQWELLALGGWRLDDVITRNQVLRLISHQRELNFKPGEEFSYCNTGYTLMGEIVSRVTGETFPEWCDKKIFEPLDMKNTLFYDDHEKIVKNRAYSYQDTPAGLKKSVLSYANAGATSLFTTAEDLTKWSDNFYSMNVGNEQVMKQMEERGVLNNGDTISYAFGQGFGTYKGLKNFAHSGGDAGYRSFLLRFPEHQLSIVVLSNHGSFQPGKLAFGVAEIYLKDYLKELPKPEAQQTAGAAVKVNDELLKSYEGQYQLTPGMIVTFKINNGTLTAQATGQPAINMIATSESEFSNKAGDIKVTFNSARDGKVNQFTLHQGGQNMIALRIKPFDPALLTLKLYEGNYYSPELQTSYTLEAKGDILIASHIRHEPLTMTPVANDAFSTEAWFMSKMEFTRNEKAEIDGFRVSSGRVRNVKFLKTTTAEFSFARD